MNKLLLELDYQTYLVCENSKDEQELIRIISNALVVKEDRIREIAFYIDRVPKVKFMPVSEILDKEPESPHKSQALE